MSVDQKRVLVVRRVGQLASVTLAITLTLPCAADRNPPQTVLEYAALLAPTAFADRDRLPC
jgi:hypothetical protein